VNQLSGMIPTFILTLPSNQLYDQLSSKSKEKKKKKKKKKKPNILFHRYLRNNYWDCPIPIYSVVGNDYSAAKDQCG